ncbi:formate dehydrogenase subunit delta [Ideonella sp.]|uniref:formate dehydrogenase subunit delta n=1 Tax=Ideonella sp. TaxID=1929293 RepID=UPI002B495C54|nr:formate dehydrogenase subunit delta [Ideonella sp.]HJV72114.1 formate dehydrogenase subunit delta [Ideonella sp.]
MDADNLVQMANRIGSFFEAMPDRTEAIEGIALHIQRYWEPRMRRELLAHVDEAKGAGLSEIVRSAIDAYRASLEPVTA